MKKIMYALTLVAAVALATSCEKEEVPGNEKPIEEPKDSIPEEPKDMIHFVDGYISFYGTDYSETNNFNIVLYTDMTTDEDGYFNSKGQAVQLDLYTTDTVLVSGKYTLSTETYEAGTFDSEYSAWYEIDDEGNQTVLGVKDGVVELSIDKDVYTINISLTDSLDSVHVGKFVGALEIYDEREDPYAYEPTTPTALTIAAPADSIEAENYGDYMEVGTDNLSLTLWDDNYSVVLSLFVESGATELPVGKYTVATDYSAMTIEPGELVYGMFPAGSYVGNDEEIFWLEDGSVEVAKTGDEYTISGELKSHYGTTVKLNYIGAVTVSVSESSSEAPASKVARKANARSAAKPLKLRK